MHDAPLVGVERGHACAGGPRARTLSARARASASSAASRRSRNPPHSTRSDRGSDVRGEHALQQVLHRPQDLSLPILPEEESPGRVRRAAPPPLRAPSSISTLTSRPAVSARAPTTSRMPARGSASSPVERVVRLLRARRRRRIQDHRDAGGRARGPDAPGRPRIEDHVAQGRHRQPQGGAAAASASSMSLPLKARSFISASGRWPAPGPAGCAG